MQYFNASRKQHGFQKMNDYSPYPPCTSSSSSNATLPSGSTAKSGSYQHIRLTAVPSPPRDLAATGLFSSDSSEIDTKYPHPASSVSTSGGDSQDRTSKYRYSDDDVDAVQPPSKTAQLSGDYRSNPAGPAPPKPKRYMPPGQVGDDGATGEAGGASPFVRSPPYDGGVGSVPSSDYGDGTMSSTSTSLAGYNDWTISSKATSVVNYDYDDWTISSIETLVAPTDKSSRQSAVTLIDNCQYMNGGYISFQVCLRLLANFYVLFLTLNLFISSNSSNSAGKSFEN